MTALEGLSGPARIADPDEDISADELGLAARNSGLPLEALRYDVTPVGLHYLLVHYDIPDVDPAGWRLRIGGLVGAPVELDLDAIIARPSVTRRATMECAGNGRARLRPRPVSQPWLVEAVGTAEWTGTPLGPLLREAGPAAAAREVVFTGADHGVERGVEQTYQRSLALADALSDEVLLVHGMNGGPLPPQHGFPLRLLVPGWYGMAQVKWLTGIEVVAEPFEGFQQSVAYLIRQRAGEAGEPVTRMEPRALLIPPGWPDFMSRDRFLRPGRVELRGRAWSGWAAVVRVELSTDGGASWRDAELGPAGDPAAWRSWSSPWDPAPGSYELCCRATDASGRTQPVEQPWNRGGFANNLVQRVPVTVLDS